MLSMETGGFSGASEVRNVEAIQLIVRLWGGANVHRAETGDVLSKPSGRVSMNGHREGNWGSRCCRIYIVEFATVETE